MVSRSSARSLPDFDRISVFTAIILLAYLLARYIALSPRTLEVQVFGVYLAWELSVRTVVNVIVAGLVATGADWLLQPHPALGGEGGAGTTVQHWFVPGLTALVLGVTLNGLPPDGLLWWAAFAIGGFLLLLVLISEYIVVDPADARYPTAVAGLTAMSFGLFLILTIVLHATNVRLVFELPLLSLAAGVVCFRTIYLRLHHLGLASRENVLTGLLAAGAVSLFIGEMAAPLHYWPISSPAYGLILLGAAYAATTLIANLTDEIITRRVYVEPAAILLLLWGIAAILR